MEFTHPELKEGEVFFTNSNSRKFQNIKLITKRLGQITYDGEGRLMNHIDWFPVFIEVREIEIKNLNLSNLRKGFRKLI